MILEVIVQNELMFGQQSLGPRGMDKMVQILFPEDLCKSLIVE